MKGADRMKVKYVVMIGDDELAKNKLVVRAMADGSQEEVAMEEIVQYLEGRL